MLLDLVTQDSAIEKKMAELKGGEVECYYYSFIMGGEGEKKPKITAELERKKFKREGEESKEKRKKGR